MGDVDIKTAIRDAVGCFSTGELSQNALRLFETLGYNTERQSPFTERTFRFFKESFLDGNACFNEAKAKVNDWKEVDLLFQLTNDEFTVSHGLLGSLPVDRGRMESYLFFVIELMDAESSRSTLAQITRQVNKVFPMPVMILFKTGGSLTLAIIDRRLNKKDERKDVLEKVTLIKDIDIANPHRAHIEILFDLSLDELKHKHKVTGIEELHKAWRKALDTQALNNSFYEKLFDWYLWALQIGKFPQIRPEEDKIDEKVHQSESLIRLLTRLLFVWFMKEKGLINPVLFDKNKLRDILTDFIGENGSETIYYKAILQNLFFATLNQPVGNRKLIEKGFLNPKGYCNHLVYRYEELLINPGNILSYFENIPFLNGGLFDCLDQRKDSNNPIEIRLDGFSTQKKNQPILPDKLFFGEYPGIDLSKEYDDKKKNKLTVCGLIDILDAYKFTIEENTPIEEEIALDPELLGKVFENLLASYNPETQSTARKQTGSFYTPREIVDYMVDESLMAYLTPALSKGEGEDLTPTLSDEEGEVWEKTPGYITTSPDIYKVLKPLTIENRQHATEAEAILWEELRNRKLSFKFRRQHPVDKYIVDFICLSANLVIEVDGEYHNSEEQREIDRVRTERLQDLGYRVLRFKNEFILKNIQNVLHSIKTALSNPPSPLERGPGGEVKLRDLLSYSENPNPFTPKETEILIKAIDACKILDPACGSGAFPMGALQKMIHLLHKLDPENKQWFEMVVKNFPDYMQAEVRKRLKNEKWNYVRKLGIIQQCIYGVDIQPIATQIAKLRFFISLLVDQSEKPNEPNRGFEPLPNLDFKIVTANTLISAPESETTETSLYKNQVDPFFEKFNSLTGQYFNTSLPDEKKKLKIEISNLIEGKVQEKIKKIKTLSVYIVDDRFNKALTKKNESQIEKNEREIRLWKSYTNLFKHEAVVFFEPRYFFPKAAEGFDIVIGNPPYVQIQNFSGMQQQKDWEQQNYETYVKTGDIYCLFYERGYRLLKKSGVLTYITSNKWMRANYGKAMRKFFIENGAISQLMDFGDSPIFKNATTYTNILVWHKTNREFKARAWDLSKTYASDVSLEDLLAQQGECEPLFNEESYVILSSEQTAIKKRIETIGVPLKDWKVSIYRGILTGLNEAFIIDRKKKDELIARDPKSAEILKPILRGRDIKRNKAEFADLWLISTFPALQINIDAYPLVKAYLESFGKKLEQNGEKGCRKKTNNKWFEVQDTIAYYNEFTKDKIVWAETSMDNQFCLVGKDFFLDKTSFFLTPGNKYLLSILNSHVTRFFLDTLVSKMRGGYFSMSKIYVEQIPIPRISKEAQLPFEILVDMVMFAREHGMNSDASTLEWVIDDMTYGLYFEPEMKKNHCYINDRIAEVIKPFTPVDTHDFKTEYIQTFVKFCDKDDTIRHGLVYSRLVKPVQIIQGDKK